MKRSNSSPGRGRTTSSRTSASKSRYPKKRSAGGDKPFRKKSDRPVSKDFSEKSPGFKKDGGSEREPRPSRFTDREKPRGDFKRGAGEKSPVRGPSAGFKGRPDRKDFKRPFDKKINSDEKFRREDGADQSKERNDGAETRRDNERTFRNKRATGSAGSSADRNKRKRVTGDDRRKKFEDSAAPDSPRAFGEKKFEKRPPKPRKQGSFERRPPGGDRPDRPWNRKEKHSFYGDRRKSAGPLVKKIDDGSTRLNKFISNAGICSRREADELITAGVISVNGKVITEMGYKVMPGDAVKYNNELLKSERLVYILLNKPKDFITTTDDPEDRKTVMNLIAKACKERVYPVGRLDRNTTGLLLFTNDGDLAKTLTHPSFQVQKIYQAELDIALKSADMQSIADGITLEDGFIKADEIVYAAKEKNVIGIELHSGKNRIVRRIFEHLGYEVKKLDRVVFAGLTKKDLPRGRWRFLTDMEIANLKMLSGKKMVQNSTKY